MEQAVFDVADAAQDGRAFAVPSNSLAGGRLMR
jgi:hypothetical protein